ncbi:hypothetical protein JCM10295v2_003740 [Rhodotorula toruloides]
MNDASSTGLAQDVGLLAGKANSLGDFGVQLLASQSAYSSGGTAIDDEEFAENAENASLREMGADADVALAANKAYQAEVIKAMDRVDAARKRISELDILLTSLSESLASTQPADAASLSTVAAEASLTELVASTRALGQTTFKISAPGTSDPGLPFFRHFYGKDIPPNPDGEARDRYLSAIRIVAWTPAERARLRQEIVAQNHRMVAKEALRLGRDITQVMASKDPKWFVENLEGLDWDQVAVVMERRSPSACRMQWLQHDHPRLNTSSKWAKDELKHLYEIVESREDGVREDNGGWEAVASELGTNRSVMACLSAYQRRPLPKEAFTQEDDERIKEAVAWWGENWQVVARHVQRNPTACHNRYTNSLLPTLRRGKWSAEEDAKLKFAVQACGKNWTAISERVEGRTDAQCRERWSNVLDPKVLGTKNWTGEEDTTLLRLRDEEQLPWNEISLRGFGGTRTDSNCLRRYSDLKKPPKKKRKKRAPKRPVSDDEDDAEIAQHDAESGCEGEAEPEAKRQKTASASRGRGRGRGSGKVGGRGTARAAGTREQVEDSAVIGDVHLRQEYGVEGGEVEQEDAEQADEGGPTTRKSTRKRVARG